MSNYTLGDKKMVWSSLTVSSLSVAVILATYLREMAVARQFGSQSEVDQYYVAFAITTAIATLTAILSVSVFTPFFLRRWLADPDQGWQAANLVLTYMILFLLAGGILVLWGESWWVHLVAPDWDPGAIRSALHLLRILFPVAVLMGVNEQLKAVLNGLKDFSVPTVTQAFPSIFSLAAVLWLGGRLGISALAWGWMLGSAAQTVVLVGRCHALGYRFRPVLRSADGAWREFCTGSLGYLLPAVMPIGLVFIDRHYASLVGGGAIAVLNYADKLFRIPMILLTTAIYTVALPYFSEQAASEKLTELRSSLSVGLRIATFLLLPCGILFLVLRRPLVQVAFQRGAFTPQDTAAVAAALVWFAPLVVVHGMWYVLERSMIALNRMKLLTLFSILMLAVKMVLSTFVYRSLGVPGLVLTTLVAFGAGAVGMYVCLTRWFGIPSALADLTALLKVGLAGAGLAVVAFAGRMGVPLWLQSGTATQNLLTLLIAGGGGLASFLSFAALLQSPEALLMGRWLRMRFNGSKPSSA